MVGLPDGEKNFEDMYNRLDSIPACDRRTDRRTSCDGIVRAMHTRRAVKANEPMLMPIRTSGPLGKGMKLRVRTQIKDQGHKRPKIDLAEASFSTPLVILK